MVFLHLESIYVVADCQTPTPFTETSKLHLEQWSSTFPHHYQEMTMFPNSPVLTPVIPSVQKCATMIVF